MTLEMKHIHNSQATVSTRAAGETKAITTVEQTERPIPKPRKKLLTPSLSQPIASKQAVGPRTSLQFTSVQVPNAPTDQRHGDVRRSSLPVNAVDVKRNLFKNKPPRPPPPYSTNESAVTRPNSLNSQKQQGRTHFVPNVHHPDARIHVAVERPIPPPRKKKSPTAAAYNDGPNFANSDDAPLSIHL